MRSLSLENSRSWHAPTGGLVNLCVDVEQDCVYVVSEKQYANVDVELEVLQAKRTSPERATLPVALFSISGFQTRDRSQVVSVRYLPDTQSLCLITLDGDIGLVSLEEGLGRYEVVGSIDAGVRSASWSPDDALLAIVSGDDKLLLMTNSFDVLREGPLHPADRGEEQPVNVGWGSKQTQFHGSLGKAAAQATSVVPNSVGSSPDDDGLTRISWRGDCAYFAVSSLDSSDGGSRRRRVLRVYDRQGVLQNTSEDVAGLEHTLNWRPSGNLIASTQRFGFDGGGAGKEGRHDVVFFERNGLRHGEFTLREAAKHPVAELSSKRPWGYAVRELLWNSDSTILAVWIERDEGDVVQLWSMSNYYWYLKQELLAPVDGDNGRRWTAVAWHPEIALSLLLLNSTSLIERKFAWETFASHSRPPFDTGNVAVVDGATLLLTPFRTQNVPPPMASHKLGIALSEEVSPLYHERAPLHLSLSPTGDALVILYQDGHLQLWALQTRLGDTPAASRGPPYQPVKLCETALDIEGNDLEPRQVCVWSVRSDVLEDAADEMSGLPKTTFRIACLSSHSNSDVVSVGDVVGSEVQDATRIIIQGSHGRLVYSDENIYWQSSEGEIHSVSITDISTTLVARFPQFSFTAQCTTMSSSKLFVGRTDSGKLYASTTDNAAIYTLASNCTSFAVSAGFVIYTTSSHEAFFAPLAALHRMLVQQDKGELAVDAANSSANGEPQWERRRVERGSRIVTAVPSTMSLVLQMPRGNLETIYPRPLVLTVVRQDIDAGNYRKAFLACRKHRVDLTFLVEHNPEGFRRRIFDFVEQIDDVDHFNLFLTSIGQSKLDPSQIASICDAVRVQLEARSLKKFVNSILTAFVVKRPPEYEAALTLLHRLRETDPDMVEDAVKYIIFLVDVDKLYDTALGMYDFSLVLLVAQHSQRDPREYLPFLRELRALPMHYQRHKIDDHLKRYSSALGNLASAGSEYFDEALAYVEKHRLYPEALELWKEDTNAHKKVLDIYGDFLYERRDYKQAGLVFVVADKPGKAIIAYERALLWRELFELAVRARKRSEKTADEHQEAKKRNGNAEGDDVVDMAYRVAEELSSKRRFAEAAQVLLDYAKDVRGAVSALGQGNLLSEARRIISLHDATNLLHEILLPAALDARVQYGEEVEEMRTQLRKQVHRLRELAQRKTEEPDAFYGIEDDPGLNDVDVMTEVSLAGTAFTRYTAAPSNVSRSTSKRSSRSKRKMERKAGSGKKGTVDEEEYLLKSITKLVTRFESTQAEVSALLPRLIEFSAVHRQEGKALQEDLQALELELRASLDEIWSSKPDGPGDVSSSETVATNADTWASRLNEIQRRQERSDVRERILKPVLGANTDKAEWTVDLLNI